jgi:hypothetical protein
VLACLRVRAGGDPVEGREKGVKPVEGREKGANLLKGERRVLTC